MYPNDDLAELKCACLTRHKQPVYWCRPPVEKIEAGPSGRKRANDDANDQPTKNRKTDKDGNQLPSCLEIGRALYHDKACGRDWTWLQDAMRPIFDEGEPDTMIYTNEQHGTILSLLLRDTFSITLKRRELQKKPNLFAHEIDELIPLMGAEDMGDEYFPFSFTANVRVPFDILSMLGVDIFRDLTFDTWVIQLVLRKLLLNVIPWDHSRRCDVDYADHESYNQKVDIPDDRARKVRLFNEGNLGRWSNYAGNAPIFNDLYIFPGVSMFNHSCRHVVYDRKEQPTEQNVMWDWDTAIPNRIIVWAWRDIPKGEQLFLEYTPYIFDPHAAKRVLGKRCECEYCRKLSPTPDVSDDDDSASSGSSPTPKHIRRSQAKRSEQIDLISSSDDNEGSSQRFTSPAFPPSSSNNRAPPYSVITNAENDKHVNSHRGVGVSKEITLEKVPSVPVSSHRSVTEISLLGRMTGADTDGNPIAVPGGRPRGRLPSERFSIGNKVYDQCGDTIEIRSQLDLDPTPIHKPRKRPSAIRDSGDEDWGKNRLSNSSPSGDGKEADKDSGKDEHVTKEKVATNNYSSILGH